MSRNQTVGPPHRRSGVEELACKNVPSSGHSNILSLEKAVYQYSVKISPLFLGGFFEDVVPLFFVKRENFSTEVSRAAQLKLWMLELASEILTKLSTLQE